MVPGKLSISAQDVIVTYADPATNKPVKANLKVEPLNVSAIIPNVARKLDPFIAAERLELTHNISGETTDLQPGNSFSWAVKATVDGVSPMFLPSLAPPVDFDSVDAYADEPVVEEIDDAGLIAGSRLERITFVAKSGGHVFVPSVSLSWYNLSTGIVEETRLDGFAISVIGARAGGESSLTTGTFLTTIIAVILICGILYWLGLRRWARGILGWLQEQHKHWRLSETSAYRQLKKAIARRDYASVCMALDAWAKRTSAPDPRGNSEIRGVMTRLGQARYGKSGRMAVSDQDWCQLRELVNKLRRENRQTRKHRSGLAALNPR
jgi:hypothetical protein